MRMWMVNPRIMCREHLLGEHVENHMFVSSIMRNFSVQGYIDNNLLEPMALETRHQELVEEMERRGFDHKSPWKGDWEKIEKQFQWNRIKDHKVDVEAAEKELLNRCELCAKRKERLNE